jgi:hypothetical protein
MHRPLALLAGLVFLTVTSDAFSRWHPDTPDKPALSQNKSSAHATICLYRMPSYFGFPYNPSVYVGETAVGRLRNGVLRSLFSLECIGCIPTTNRLSLS